MPPRHPKSMVQWLQLFQDPLLLEVCTVFQILFCFYIAGIKTASFLWCTFTTKGLSLICFGWTQMDNGHYSGVTMEQVILCVIILSEYKIPGHNSITSYLPMSKKAKEGNVRKELPKSISLKILFGFIMLISPANTCEHKTKAIVFRNVGGFEALHCCFCCPLINYILI